ncbi:unnamed protein product [Withania somnifera]
MLSPTIKVKARRREGGAAGEGKRFRRSRFFFHRKRRRPRMAYGASYLKGTRFFDRRGVHVAAVSAPFLVNGAQQVRHLLQKRESTSDNHVSARQRVEWPRADLFGYIIQVESRRALFSLRIPRSLSCEFPSGEFQTCGALSIPSLEPRRKPPTLRTPYIF